jgi:hypothetical protein
LFLKGLFFEVEIAQALAERVLRASELGSLNSYPERPANGEKKDAAGQTFCLANDSTGSALPSVGHSVKLTQVEISVQNAEAVRNFCDLEAVLIQIIHYFKLIIWIEPLAWLSPKLLC